MLYKLASTDRKFDTLQPVEFTDVSNFGKNEKDLENLISNSILEVLFEESGLMPVCQEKQGQSVADIYALDEKGDLVIFELKTGTASRGAVHQALLYAQDAGQWSYETLQKKYRQYKNNENINLREAHQDDFLLEHQLDVKEINNKQRLIVIGSAADDSLINAVDYWKNQGISIDFLPYRIYELNSERYFEFFALPYDRHRNPRDTKGVIFDTNRRYDEKSIWYMMEKRRVAAWGDAKRYVGRIHPGDIVFFSHRLEGLVAAGRMKKGDIVRPDEETWYRDVEFITPIPHRDQERRAMPFSRVSEITGKSFYWASTIKAPYLSNEEAQDLAVELKAHLENL